MYQGRKMQERNQQKVTMAQREWTCGEISILYRDYPMKDTEEVAKRLKRSKQAVLVKAHLLGIKKKKPAGVEWTPQMISTLGHFFPTMFNRYLAQWLGVSLRTLIRKARELGLEKEEGFLDKKREKINELAGEALRARGDVDGTWFKKGVRNNPSGEFKKGHKESAETKAKRIAALKAAHKRKKQQSIKLY